MTAIARIDAERQEARQLLAALQAEHRDIVSAQADVATDDEHDPEGATIAFERQRVAALVAATQERLAALDAAEQRVGEGSYGRCNHCGGDIPAARLDARPTTTTCIDCARG